MKLTMPVPGKTLVRLLQDVTIPDANDHRNGAFCRDLVTCRLKREYREAKKKDPTIGWWGFTGKGTAYNVPTPRTIPAGTVFQFGSYRNTTNPDSGYMTMLVVASPDRELLPPSRGGNGARVSLAFRVHAFNALGMDVEVLPDAD